MLGSEAACFARCRDMLWLGCTLALALARMAAKRSDVTREKKLPECFTAYEDGKHRRYSLLFAVNGGAFAVAKLLSDPETRTVLGGLSLSQLSVGMILFTSLMVVDIFLFGQNMRSTLPKDAFDPNGKTVAVFATPGKGVLILIGVLICAGWFLAAYGGARPRL